MDNKNNKKFFSIGSVFSKFFSSPEPVAKVEEVTNLAPRKMTAQEENQLAMQILNNMFANSAKNNTAQPQASMPLSKKNTTTGTTDPAEPPGIDDYENIIFTNSGLIPEPKGVSDNDKINNTPSKPLPPPFGEKYVSQPRPEGYEPKLPPALGQPFVLPQRADGKEPQMPPPFGEKYVSQPRKDGEEVPLPPKFDAEYLPKKKTENSDDSGESAAPEIKLPSHGQVSERIRKTQEWRAELERMEKERLVRVHVHSR